jgi:hypothetical protein
MNSVILSGQLNDKANTNYSEYLAKLIVVR